jgi:hypothetical protein
MSGRVQTTQQRIAILIVAQPSQEHCRRDRLAVNPTLSTPVIAGALDADAEPVSQVAATMIQEERRKKWRRVGT